jgi:ubiquinone/menaquinone biosynthesis C-methylase UbiE
MGFYSEVVYPRLCDLFLDRPYLARYRRELLAEASGEVLEIGVGTGLNLPHYPPRVRRIVTIEPNPAMSTRLARRAKEAGIEVDARLDRGEALPFEEAAFDCVVTTLTLCSIADVDQAAREMYRVLKPGGRFLFFEHGLSPEPQVARRQRRWNWLQRRLAKCRLDLDVRELLASQPFRSLEVDNFYLEKSPKTHGYIYRGVAIK